MIKKYSYKKNSKKYGIWQLIQANVLFPLFAFFSFQVFEKYFAGISQPAIFIIGIIVFFCCTVIFNIVGIINIRKNQLFKFDVNEDYAKCDVPIKIYGRSFELRIDEIEKILIESTSESFNQYIITKNKDKFIIPEFYGNNINKIIKVFENLGIVVKYKS